MKYFKFLLLFFFGIMVAVLVLGYGCLVLISIIGGLMARVASVAGAYACDLIALCVFFYAEQADDKKMKVEYEEYNVFKASYE